MRLLSHGLLFLLEVQQRSSPMDVRLSLLNLHLIVILTWWRQATARLTSFYFLESGGATLAKSFARQQTFLLFLRSLIVHALFDAGTLRFHLLGRWVVKAVHCFFSRDSKSKEIVKLYFEILLSSIKDSVVSTKHFAFYYYLTTKSKNYCSILDR